MPLFIEFIFYPFIFLFGLVIGSFLNVVIFRLETGEQVVSGRSHCRDCQHTLKWYDLVPLLSFIMLGAKCRYCGKPISIQYPLVELFTGILFVLLFQLTINSKQLTVLDGIYFTYLLIVSCSLLIIFVYDLKHYIIPDKIVYPAIIVSMFTRISEVGLPKFGSPTSEILINFIFAALIAGSFFLAIVLITKGRGMGGGDVKLAFLMGLVLGWPKILAALFLAFTIGAIYGIILIIIKKKTLKSEVPFGPFLVGGTFIALFWGEEIVRWYMGFI